MPRKDVTAMNDKLGNKERKLLLELAREAVDSSVRGTSLRLREVTQPQLLTPHGCFVTIKKGGALRGCIGNFSSERPLYLLVQEMAAAAATHDPRFYPMKEEDLAAYDLEISVLSPLTLISSEDDGLSARAIVESVVIGTHGLYLEKNFSRGVLLPQVAVEQRWDRETFLNQTALKAGLAKDDWREGANIFVFTAQVFGEHLE
jgi:AmmeMemoRadiSam system protein A